MKRAHNVGDASEGCGLAQEVRSTVGIALANVPSANRAAVHNHGKNRVMMEGAQPIKEIRAALRAQVVVEQNQGRTRMRMETAHVTWPGQVLDR